MTNTKTAAKSAPKNKRPASLDRKKARAGWVFVLPFVLGFLIIYLPIIIESIRLSFYRIKPITGGGFELLPVGLQNYQEALFVDPDFVKTLVSGLKQLCFDIPAIVIFSLFMAVLLNQKMFGRAAFRAIFFVPVILSTGLIESIDAQNIMSEYMEGSEGINDGSGESVASELVSAMDVERLFANMKVGSELVTYVTTMINNIYNIVNRSGVQMLIFLSGLQSISPAIYESCSIDGATAWETFWKITFPMISPMILVNGIYTIIDSFTSESNQVMTFISGVYEQADGNVISSAMSWMYFIIVMLIIAAVAGVMSAYVFYQRRD
ncbi:MAG: sugar ABC transporter permease [Clostridia bacterium]|nr:sugar ABC transporter permease [Clostridia bacterium]MBQ9150996.1 sugar ABC transporter permease [Clostridia bacterium]